MKSSKAIIFFALIAIAIGLIVSYRPPEQHSEAIWLIVTAFLAHLGSYLIPGKSADLLPALPSPASPVPIPATPATT